MQILRPLRSRPLALVWTGQVLAATGYEFYLVAVVWIATSLIGNDAGYVTALQSGALLFGSLFGGLLTDRVPTRTTMVTASLGRAVVLALLALANLLGLIGLPLLIVSAVLVALGSACFDPALQSIIPVLAPDPATRHATNGLFDATRRVARILGPGLIGIASAVMPVGGFFGVTAAAFLAATACVAAGLRPLSLPAREPVHGLAGILDSLTGGFRAVRGHRVLVYGLVVCFVGNIGWGLGIILGMILHLRATRADPILAYSLMMMAYGVGNVLASVVLASGRPRRPIAWLIAAKLVFGGGLVLMPYAGSQAALMLCALVAAFNGPLENLSLFSMMQDDLPASRLAQVFRVQMATVFSGGTVAYLAAPSLFDALGVAPTVMGIGLACVAAGLAGLPLLRRG
jgi:MFS transporter, DHA3 family, macrolide efflux protein